MINGTLRELGISGNCCSLIRTNIAIRIALDEPDTLLYVTKLLYPRVAKECGCSWQAAERSIRSAVASAWDCNPELLCKMARHPMDGPPTASQFIDIVADYIRRKKR